jgi:trigger factor
MATASAAAPETANDVRIEDVGPARKKLTITVPPRAVRDKLEQSIGTLLTESSLPGFRKGRVPRQLLEKRFGAAMRTEARNQLVAEAYAAAVEQQGLKPIGEPTPVTPMDDLKLEEGQALSFAIEVEVVPEFDIPALEGLQIKRPIMEITDAHIEQELHRQSMIFGKATKIEDTFAPHDRLIGRAVVTRAGQEEPIFEHDEVPVIVPTAENDGRGQVLGLLIDGLADTLRRHRVGDTVELHVKAPESHEREDIRGADLTISFSIRSAAHIDPATPQQVADQFGLGTEEILREQIRLALEQRRDQEQAAAMREQVFEHLLATVDFPLPEKLSTASIARTLDRMRMELLYRGLSVDDVETRIAEVRADSEAETRKRIRLFFILHRLAEHLGVESSELEVNGRIASMAMQRRVRPEKLKQELAQTGQLGEVARQIREHKVADRIVQLGRLSDVPADEWNTMVAEKNKAASRGRAPARAPARRAPAAKAAEEPSAAARKPASKPRGKAAAETAKKSPTSKPTRKK